MRIRVTRMRIRVTRMPIRVTRMPIRVTRMPIRVTRMPIRVTRMPIRVTRMPINVTSLGINVTALGINVTEIRPDVTRGRAGVTAVRRGPPPIIAGSMRFKGKYPPKTPAERQRECRARKRGEDIYCQVVPRDQQSALPPPNAANPTACLPPPQAKVPALPAPPVTAIQKATSTASTELGLPRAFPDVSADAPAEALRLSLPPAVAARLKSLLDRHHAGGGSKPLTAAERAEAEGLLDIAEYFVVQRLRQRLAA
jgi:hypothetical protein